jgi:hypothetical protein
MLDHVTSIILKNHAFDTRTHLRPQQRCSRTPRRCFTCPADKALIKSYRGIPSPLPNASETTPVVDKFDYLSITQFQMAMHSCHSYY